MKTSLLTKVGMAAVGVLLLGWLGLTLFTGSESTQSGPAELDDKHCPVCGRELPRGAQATGVCPYCELEKGPGAGNLAAAKRRGGAAVAGSPVVPAALIALFGVLLTAHVVFLVRGRLAREREVPRHVMHCAKCGRKLSYRDSQVGRFGRCPICHRPIIFPRPESEAPRGGWLTGLRRANRT
jgi:hypothetical protein